MASYYYLIASLPMLKFDASPPFTTEEFLVTCEQGLVNSDYQVIADLVAGRTEQARHPSLVQWNNFRAQLRATLHEQRAGRLGGTAEEQRSHVDRDLPVAEAVRAAMQAENPLEAELILMRLQWSYASQLSQGHVFDVEVLIAYAIQLGILERKALYVPMEGQAEFKRLFSNLQSIIKSI